MVAQVVCTCSIISYPLRSVYIVILKDQLFHIFICLWALSAALYSKAVLNLACSLMFEAAFSLKLYIPMNDVDVIDTLGSQSCSVQ